MCVVAAWAGFCSGSAVCEVGFCPLVRVPLPWWAFFLILS